MLGRQIAGEYGRALQIYSWFNVVKSAGGSAWPITAIRTWSRCNRVAWFDRFAGDRRRGRRRYRRIDRCLSCAAERSPAGTWGGGLNVFDPEDGRASACIVMVLQAKLNVEVDPAQKGLLAL